MIKILFVCMGNICRSPTAEGVMKSLVKKAGKEKEIFVDSAGTSGWHEGGCPDARSISCAKDHGVNIKNLTSRKLLADDFKDFDLILVMDEQNLRDVQKKRPYGDADYDRAKVQLLLDYAPEYGFEVPDPYYLDGFDNVYEMIEEACKNLLTELMQSTLTMILR